MNYSEDFLAGWAAARAAYQGEGAVPPFPPGYEPQAVSLDVQDVVHETAVKEED